MKNIVVVFIFISIAVLPYAQNTMNIHLNNGSVQSFLLDNVDSITYNNAPPTYNIGSRGPANGFVFYDKGFYSEGWRYIEVTANDINSSLGTSCSVARAGDIGAGKANTLILVNECGSGSNHAATTCYNYVSFHNGVLFDDWFLPSIQELSLIFNIVNSNSFHWNFTMSNYITYWSSSYTGSNWNLYIAFGDGSIVNASTNDFRSVRAVRYF